MTLIDAQNEIYQSLLEEGETELAEAWKEVGDMMQGGLDPLKKSFPFSRDDNTRHTERHLRTST